MNAEELVSQEAVSPSFIQLETILWTTFLHCVLSNVSSNGLPTGQQGISSHYTVCICFICLYSLAKRSQGIAPSCQFWLFRLKSANTVLYEGTFFHFMVYHSYPSKLNAGKYKVQCQSANWRWNDVSGPVARFAIALGHFVQLSNTHHIIIYQAQYQIYLLLQ